MAAVNGVLYVTTGFGEVFALDPRTGGTIWKRTLDASIQAPPLVYDGRVVAVQRDDIAVAMDARSGETLWTTQGAGGTGLMGGASPAGNGPLVIVPFSSGELLGVLGRNGTTIWGTAITGGRRALARNRINDVTGDPVIVGDTSMPRTRAGGRSASTPRPASAPGRSARAPTGRRGRSAAPSTSSRTWARWSASTPRAARSSGRGRCPSSSRRATSCGGRASRGGRCPTTGRCSPAAGCGWRAPTAGCAASVRSTAALLASIELPGGAAAAPAVAGGVLYVTTREGQLLAFQ